MMEIERDKMIQIGEISGAQDLLRSACKTLCEATGDDKMADLLIDAWGDTLPEAVKTLNLDDDQVDRVMEDYIGPFKRRPAK